MTFHLPFCLTLFFTIGIHLIASAIVPDVIFIRHGKSRVRHFTEKDNIRWNLQLMKNNSTHDINYESYDNESAILFEGEALYQDIIYFPNHSKNTHAWETNKYNPAFEKKSHVFNSKMDYLNEEQGFEVLVTKHNMTKTIKNFFPPNNSENNTEVATPTLANENEDTRNLPHYVPVRVPVSYTKQLLHKENAFDENVYINENEIISPYHVANEDVFPEKKVAAKLVEKQLLVKAHKKQDGQDENLHETVLTIADEDLLELDEVSLRNRMNLLKGRDVVTKFLQIVETQHLLGANCTAGTALNLGEGIVDQYAQDRFRIEAEVAVNRANMLTRIFKHASPSVQASEHLLHASVLSMVEFDDDIFAAGNCFDWNQHPSKPGLFCPFAYRLPPPDQGAAFAKDLAAEYHYLGNTSEWFFLARKNAEKVITKNNQYSKAYHYYSNSSFREPEMTLTVKYEDGRWSKPYYDCGGGNIWMLTYTVPFFGFANGSYFFKGTSGIDIDLRRVDIDQCSQKVISDITLPLNIFAGTDKCKQRTTMCISIPGLGFRRGSYKCVCRKGYYFPDATTIHKFFNGSLLEEEYEKLMLGEFSTYNNPQIYECLPCAEGCDFCETAAPCVAALNWPMRTTILVLACATIGLLPPAAWFTFRYQQIKVTTYN